jgi:hypothetical protein
MSNPQGEETMTNLNDAQDRKWSEEANTFIVGGVEFTALRRNHPRIPGKPMWLVQVNESGEIWEPGACGVSNESRPKLQADLEDLYQFAAKRDQAEWRRQLKLPAGEAMVG